MKAYLQHTISLPKPEAALRQSSKPAAAGRTNNPANGTAPQTPTSRLETTLVSDGVNKYITIIEARDTPSAPPPAVVRPMSTQPTSLRSWLA